MRGCLDTKIGRMDVPLNYRHITILITLYIICCRCLYVHARSYQHEAWDDVRLVNGSDVWEGRVEVNIVGLWGTVCDNQWSLSDGYVVCRQLGYDGVEAIYHGAHFGKGNGHVFYDQLQCNRSEAGLAHCPGIHDFRRISCSHDQDAGVRCLAPRSKRSQTSTCHKNQFHCVTDNKCIPTRWACDHHSDCSHHEDEGYRFCREHHSCGKQSNRVMSHRIVNGNDAKLGEWPWMTSLVVKLPMTDKDTAFCGGTLFRENWVLTAAHCFDNYNPTTSTFRVVLGSVNLQGADSARQEVAVAHVYVHSQYLAGSHRNDIALLKLVHPVHTGSSSYTGPACLPVFSIPPFNSSDTCYITGWGNTQRSGPTTILQQAVVPILDNTECQHWYNNTLTDGMMCAGYRYGGIDACHGDSGGPLSCVRHGRWYVAGIVSWGHGCAQHPGIYTDIRQYTTWIWTVIQRSATFEASSAIVGR